MSIHDELESEHKRQKSLCWLSVIERQSQQLTCIYGKVVPYIFVCFVIILKSIVFLYSDV